MCSLLFQIRARRTSERFRNEKVRSNRFLLSNHTPTTISPIQDQLNCSDLNFQISREATTALTQTSTKEVASLPTARRFYLLARVLRARAIRPLRMTLHSFSPDVTTDIFPLYSSHLKISSSYYSGPPYIETPIIIVQEDAPQETS